MTFALGTSAAVVRAAPLLLVDLETHDGVTGRTYVFCYRRSAVRPLAALIEDAVEIIKGEPTSPLAANLKLERRFALLGVTGLVRMALSAIDSGAIAESC
jgi:mandelate racemase